MSVERLIDWLVDGAPGAADPADVVTRMAEELHDEGIEVDRIAVFVSTLHPDVFGRSFTWARGGPTVTREIVHEFLSHPAFLASPVNRVLGGELEVRRRLHDPLSPRDFEVVVTLATEGFTDYLVLPMTFTTGQRHALTFATKGAGGFRESDVDALRRIARPLARLAEILALRRVTATLLDTYVGRNAGAKVLAGRIRLGDVEDLRAVIWFSDLRGFTQLSQRVSPREVIAVLNQAFACQVAAVHQHGGEVLKFMGDGMLAIFPLQPESDVGARCDAALQAALEAREAFAKLRDDASFGLALHVGDLAYGNIGGHGRLDFTAIGPAVNLSARIEGLTSRVGPILLSADFAAQCSRSVASAGVFELKGVEGGVEVFVPA